MSMAAVDIVKLPAELPAESVEVLVDSREQLPWALSPLRTREGSLQTGDYCLSAAPNALRIERKSLDDYLACCGVERERFTREMERMLAFPCRVLVIESSWGVLSTGGWRSKITPASVVGTTVGWLEMGIQVVLAGDRMHAEDFAKRLLYLAARRRWREARGFVAAMSGEGKSDE